MGVAVSLSNAVVEAEPGAATAFVFRVENTGMVVDSVLLDVLGDAREWAQAEPATLNLLPGTGEQARIVFRPPRLPSVPAGEVPFAVRAMSSEDPAGSVIEEGAVRVGAFAELAAELVPKSASGRRRARQKLIVENRGNEPDEVRISAEDSDEALSFRIKPDAATIQPGMATFVRFSPVPHKRFLKGPTKTLPFQAFVLPTKADPVTADGAMLQRQIMPEWLLPALAIAAVAGAALVALWFTLLKPTIQAAATQAVNQQTQQLAASAKKADQAANEANQAAKSANTALVAAASGSSQHPAAKPAAQKKNAHKNKKTQTAGKKAGSSGKKAGKHVTAAGSSPTATPSSSPTSPAATPPGVTQPVTPPGIIQPGVTQPGVTQPGVTQPGVTQPGATSPVSGSPVSGFLQSNASPASGGSGGAYATYSYPVSKGDTLNVSDIVLENPLGNSGLLQIRAGKQTLFEFGLADFRSVDYHFVQALQFTQAAPLTLAVQCANAGGSNCTAALSFSGTLHK